MRQARLAMLVVVLALSGLPGDVAAAEPEIEWRLGEIERVRINLDAEGAGLGLEREIDGDVPAVEELVALIDAAAPGEDHKCSNAGVVRFTMTDGSAMAVGLLPSHTQGLFDLRLYKGERFVGVVTVDRSPLMMALIDLGVSGEQPWMKK